MATISPKIWSWRGHYSGQNILFFQVIKIKLAVNEGTLSIHVSKIYVKLSFYKKHFATQYHFRLLNLGQDWEIFRNLQIGNFCFFCVFQIEFTLCCHNFILNDIHDLMTFITNKQNTKQIWVGPFQFNLIKCF